MNAADILVLSGVGVAVIAAIAWIIRRRRQGKSGCGCCPYRGKCGGRCTEQENNVTLSAPQR